MKKVFTIILASALAFTFSSCQKSEIEKPVEGVPMTLTASIDVPQADTKTAVVYDDVNKVLKTSWVEGDKVSVLTLNSYNQPVSNDIFIATSVSGHTADFTGTFTGGTEYSKIIVQYPALTTDKGSEYVSDGDYATYKVSKANNNSHFSFNNGFAYKKIELDGDLSGFNEFDVMKGEGNINGDGKLVVTLEKMISVIRLEIDGNNIPDATKISKVVLKCDHSCFRFSSWVLTNSINLNGNSSSDYLERSFNKEITSDKKMVVYLPNAGTSNLNGSNIWIEVITEDDIRYTSYEKTMSASHILEPGFIYTFKAKIYIFN